MSSLDCDIPFGEFFAEKAFGDISLCCNEKNRQKPDHISTSPPTISAYSLDCVYIMFR